MAFSSAGVAAPRGQSRALVDAFFTQVLAPDVAGERAVATIVHPGVVVHTGGPRNVVGREAFGELLRDLHVTLSGTSFRLDAVTDLGDAIVVRWTGSWEIRRWPFPGMRIEVPGAVTAFRLRDGRIAEIWSLDSADDPLTGAASASGDRPEADPDRQRRPQPPWEGDDDDDDGPVGPPPPGPRWIPPLPKPKPPPKRGRPSAVSHRSGSSGDG